MYQNRVINRPRCVSAMSSVQRLSTPATTTRCEACGPYALGAGSAWPVFWRPSLLRPVTVGDDVADYAVFDHRETLRRLAFEVERHARCQRMRVIVSDRDVFAESTLRSKPSLRNDEPSSNAWAEK